MEFGKPSRMALAHAARFALKVFAQRDWAVEFRKSVDDWAEVVRGVVASAARNKRVLFHIMKRSLNTSNVIIFGEES